ncbi:NADH:quinone oxidoreductase I, chain G (cl35703 superfamily) [Aliarcobacter faecis]|uniref:NADH-quinone oxidoreductase subunit G n=1 Tax=Aliarcobacter faecis TaxID=1564138 RepID=UPI0004B84B71|nr:NADH-quinone oxidoreductase subunit G [Aliarcobacter faecis]QKF72330.1 NADH:quinone oxidoreductase I, chain G (cl35703 superfamily) [Aliarcobacter faecis]
MSQIKLTINGKEFIANPDETILNIARRNNIFIPAICYLNSCSATLACRLCLVEVDGKQVYACNAKAKENIQVITSNANIEKERNAIMQVYCVNHPLQCGVCDKSGECELQNYTLYMQVTNQNYSIKDTHKPKQKWGVMNYDPALCIVCERCVTVCSDIIGSNSLSTTKRGGEELDKSLKDSMPKDAYSMWNKLNKSLITHDSDSCISCGECIAVCPTGAMISNNFQYTSNAWELEKVPAANPFYSDCSFMFYEVKQTSIDETRKKVYRVTNEFHFQDLCGAARFCFDYENKDALKDKLAFDSAIEAFKKAKNIVFNSFITNEEALILQKIANFTDAKLVNNEAKLYKEFLENYSKTSGSSLYNGSLETIKNSQFIVSIGSALKTDAPSIKNTINNSVKVNKATALFFHPLIDTNLELVGKKGRNTEFIYHKPKLEEYIFILLLKLYSNNLPKEFEHLINFEDSFLLEKLEKDESLLELFNSYSKDKDSFTLVIGEDIITHKNAEFLAKIIGLIAKYTNFKVLIIPPKTNSLGVSLICSLENRVDGFTVGYNEIADFTLASFGKKDLDMPTLLEQEGTFTNLDKRVVPTNAALKYNGYSLNDISNTLLNKDIEYTIEYTKELPINSGFSKKEFDSLPNDFLNSGLENRGYLLNSFSVNLENSIEIPKIEALNLQENELYVYRKNPLNQVNEFTSVSKEFKNNLEDGIFFSKELFLELNLEKGAKVEVTTQYKTLILNAYIDIQLAGKIPYISTFLKNENKKLFLENRYEIAKIKKV